jgi:4-amino-4-deoxy-L-arabinose transferase-like glycosyltransferase
MRRPIIGILLAAVLLRLAFAFGISRFRVAGLNCAAVQVAQALLGAFAAWILYRFGRWVLCERLGLWAAGLYAVCFASIEHSAKLYAEDLYFPVFLALAWVLSVAVARGSARFGGLAGIILGLSLLTRGTLALFPPFLAAALPVLRRVRPGWRHWPRWMIPATLGTVLALTPWMVRNHRLTGALVPMSSRDWAPFDHGIQSSPAMLHGGDFRGTGNFLLHLPLLFLFVLGSFLLARREPAAFARAWPAFLLVVFVGLFQALVFPLARNLPPAVALSLLWGGYGLEFLLRRDRACA